MGWGSPKTVGLFPSGIVLLVAWVMNEQRAPEPLVDMEMMRIRGVWTVNAAAFLVGAGMYSSFILIPQFVETPRSAGYGFGANVAQAGLFLVPCTLMMLVTSPIAGRITDRIGAGIGLAFASLANLIVIAVRPEQTGVATGMNTVMRTLGGSVGAQIGASIIAGMAVAGAAPTEQGFTLAFLVAAVACGLAALASAAVPRPVRAEPDPRHATLAGETA